MKRKKRQTMIPCHFSLDGRHGRDGRQTPYLVSRELEESYLGVFDFRGFRPFRKAFIGRIKYN